MIIDIRNEDERQEMLRALRLLKKYPLPNVPSMDFQEEQLKSNKLSVRSKEVVY